ncbi:MAG: helix-turn-helix domain-containing protein [Candidatus Lokiarchaeota archaeon]|nr:helix-turn-helix domain-containing protein [Candidatus Lokiarchaeota archaeon]
MFWVLSEKCRLLYNFALAERIENWHQNKRIYYFKEEFVIFYYYLI